MKKLSPKSIVVIVIIVIGVFFLFSSFYTVDKDERAVVTRFGKYLRTAGPGLNLKMPFGIELATKIPVRRILKEEFGFKTIKAGIKSEFYKGKAQIEEARMLTADLKIIQIEWIIQYKITDPVNFLFKVRDPKNSLRAFAIIAMSQIAGNYLFDEIITIAKSEMTNKMQELLQSIINKLEMGILIKTVELINVTPPREVETSYNEVLQAQQEKERIINEAKQEYNKKVIPVEGQAERMIAEAEGYKAERVKVASGDAKYFNSLYREYIKAPEVTKKRIYLETMSEILPNMEKIYIIDEKQKNLVPLLQMGLKSFTEKGE
ncbi:MAG: FtsH protease activity modulator HflK [Spirochaetes bacterium]|nr:FtsH protease activity modulator HflK [Spirochaetota bacterium]